METKIISDIREAARLLQRGEVVAFPTETVYGLGADATLGEAIAKIFAAKGRPSDNPLIVHIASVEQLGQVVTDVPNYAKKLMDAFWPGPLTLVLPKSAEISSVTTAGLSTVGVRVPDHPTALRLLEAANIPIAAPSANVSGRPSPTKAAHVFEDLNGKIPAILDGGDCEIGLESTVLDCTTEIPVILRPGNVSKEQMEAVIGRVEVSAPDVQNRPKSPGMKYQHYAPKAPLVVIQSGEARLLEEMEATQNAGKRIGILVAKECAGQFDAHVVIPWGSLHNNELAEQELYDCLRKFDHLEVDIIFAVLSPEQKLSAALENRLYKAAGGNVM